MYSPIEKELTPGARRPPSCTRWALAVLAGVAATSCSNANGIVVAKIFMEAGTDDASDAKKCSVEDYKVKDMGVDLYIIFDHSEWWGMQPPFSPMVTWLTGFFADPNFAGIGVGLASYPVLGAPPDATCFDRDCPVSPAPCWCVRDNCGCTATSMPDPLGYCQCLQGPTTCDDTLYRPDKGIVRLAESGGDLESTLYEIVTRQFVGAPAIRPAVQGALNYRATWEAMPQNDGRHLTQVLVATASSNADCDRRNADTVKLLTGPGKPRTYVVAVNATGSELSDLDDLALAGGTDAATEVTIRLRPPLIIPTTNPFVDIAEKVRALDGRCEYLLPESVTDPNMVNLLATSGGAAIPRVSDRAACQRAGAGWFWDPNQDRRIVACDVTCKTTLRATSSGVATIQYGCPTVTASSGL